jgi:ATP-binding cassette, subfamily B, bacterial
MAKKTHSRRLLRGALRLLGSFRPQIMREKTLLLLALLAVVFAVAFEILAPWPLKYIYDSIYRAGGHARAARLPLAGALSPQAVILMAAISLVAITGLYAITEYFSTVYLALAASRILTRVRARLFAHVANLSIAFHDRSKTGDIITRVTHDIDRLREVTVTAILPFATNSLVLIGMLAVMFWMNWSLALVSLVAFPAFFIAMLQLTRRIRKASGVQRSREGAVAATTAEAIGSIRIVQALSLQGRFLDVFSADNKASLRAGVRTQRLTASLERTAEVLVASTTAVVLWSGARQVLGGGLSPGDLIVFVSYLRTAFKPLRQLAKYVGQMAKALASGDRVLELLHTVPEIRDGPNAFPAPPFDGHVRFENVSFEYEPGQPVLRAVSFEVEPGQRVAVVGPSGGGKSTLASLLLRFHDPNEGRILIDGHDIREYKLESLRAQISIVMQDSTLFGVSVRDNIAFGAADAGMARVVEAAGLANAQEFIEQMPNQYDTVLGERGVTVSGGQRQRIAIARAAVRRAPIVILDEPTTGLDRKNEREVTAALDRLTKNRTTLLITHNLDAVRDTDLVLYLADGRIVERGNHAELLSHKGTYAAMYLRQSHDNPAREGDFAFGA